MSDTTKFKVGDKVRFRARAQSSTEPMQIKRIVGRDHYVGYMIGEDARPWLAGNLILDSEWKEMHDERPVYQKLGLPLVERGYPMPSPPPARKKHKTTPRKRRVSKWSAFLKGLRPGDSFLLGYPDAGTMRTRAKKLRIALRWSAEVEKAEDGKLKSRYWRA